MADTDYMLTTTDNPYDPFDDFEHWFMFDEIESRHHTCGLLARLAHTSSSLTEEQNLIIIERAMDRICFLFPGLYRKIERNSDMGGGSSKNTPTPISRRS